MPCCRFHAVSRDKDKLTQINRIAQGIHRACICIGYGEGSDILRTGTIKIWQAFASQQPVQIALCRFLQDKGKYKGRGLEAFLCIFHFKIKI